MSANNTKSAASGQSVSQTAQANASIASTQAAAAFTETSSIVTAIPPSLTPQTTTVSTSATSTRTAKVIPRPTDLPGGYPFPDPYYNSTANGLVTILYLSSQSTPQLMSYHASFNANPPIRIDHRVFTDDQGYDVYVDQVLQSCKEGTGKGLFDVVLVEAGYTGVLGDCLLDLSGWDPKIADGLLPAGVQNSMVNNRLVSLPVEADFGVLYYNVDMLDRAGQSHPPKSFDELEASVISTLLSERSIENFAVSGIAGQFTADEWLTIASSEWLYGANYSTYLNPTGTNVTFITTAAADVIARVAGWSANMVLDPDDLGPQDDGTPQEVYSLKRFLSQKSVYLRHWASTYNEIKSANPEFWWGVGPVIGSDANVNVGALGGWSAGVYKYSANPAAAVKVVKWLASEDYQRNLILNMGTKIIPTRPNLYYDHQICSVIEPSLCSVYQTITPALRPAAPAGKHYPAVSSQIATAISDILNGETSLLTGFISLDTSLRKELNISAPTNETAIDDVVPDVKIDARKDPPHLSLQLAGLFLIIVLTGAAFLLNRMRTITLMKKEEELSGPNEFAHLDEEAEGGSGDEEPGGAAITQQLNKQKKRVQMSEVVVEKSDISEKAGKKGGLANLAAGVGTDSDFGIDRSEKAEFI